jgi:peptidoglycan-associated lipoprotein
MINRASGLALLAALALAACSTSPEDAATSGTDPNAGTTTAGTVPEGSVEYFNSVVGDRVFFAFDSSALSGMAQDTLRRQADWLNANPGVQAVIEGHADERGTREYNLALGDRRANAVRSFLIGLGVEPERVRTISYGEERPVAAGSNPEAWAQNRRAQTLIGPMS